MIAPNESGPSAMTSRRAVVIGGGRASFSGRWQKAVERAGFRAVSTLSSQVTLSHARLLQPAAVLLSEDIGPPGSSETARRIKKNPDTGTIPVIILAAPAEERPRFAQSYPVEATLPMNVDEDQLTATLRMLAGSAGGKTIRRKTVVALGGDLEGSLLPDVLEYLFLTGKRGWVAVTSLPLRGAIYIDRGHVLHAEFGGTRGRAAFFRTCFLGRGHFRFYTTLEAPAPTMRDDGVWLLLEAARLSDTILHKREKAKVGDASSRPCDSYGEPWHGTARPLPNHATR